MRVSQAWCTEKNKHKIMDPDLAEDLAEILDEYRDALIWCSRSVDFANGGQDEKGWNNLCQPLIDEPGQTILFKK